MPKEDNNQKRKRTKVLVRFPDKLEIQMVQSNDLHQYELFQWLTIFFAPIASGFWTQWVVNPSSAYGWSAVVFSATTVLFLILALIKRKKLVSGSVAKSVDLDDFPHHDEL